MKEDSGIDRAAARSHHQSVERRVSHRGHDALSIFDGAQRGTIADVTGHHSTRGINITSQLCGLFRAILMADSMKSKALDMQLLVPAVRSSVNASRLRHGSMK